MRHAALLLVCLTIAATGEADGSSQSEDAPERLACFAWSHQRTASVTKSFALLLLASEHDAAFVNAGCMQARAARPHEIADRPVGVSTLPHRLSLHQYARHSLLTMEASEGEAGDLDEQSDDQKSEAEVASEDKRIRFKFAYKLKQQWLKSCQDFKVRPLSYLMIPVVSAIVGYITNLVGVKMLFFPVQWRGIPIFRFPEQPFGWLGWQGVVPAKRYRMAEKLVDVAITQLLNVQELCNRLDPRQLARILEPDVRSRVLGGWVPPFITRAFLRKSVKGVIKRGPEVVDIRKLVVSGLTIKANTLSNFFQDVGRKELDFLVNSGFGVGFVLGLFQLLQWMVFPKGWTLPVSGSIVGYITNWVALKWIFQPLDPVQIGPFRLQGKFLTRQNEVSEQFSEYIAKKTLCSNRIWADILGGKNSGLFIHILSSSLPLPLRQVKRIVTHLKTTVGSGSAHALHAYTDQALDIQRTLEKKMKAMSTRQFEQVLHPIFQEDELTLILAGAVLGAAAGGLQWWQNDKIDDTFNKLQAKFAAWRARRSEGKNGTAPSPSSSSSPSPPSPTPTGGTPESS